MFNPVVNPEDMFFGAEAHIGHYPQCKFMHDEQLNYYEPCRERNLSSGFLARFNKENN